MWLLPTGLSVFLDHPRSCFGFIWTDEREEWLWREIGLCNKRVKLFSETSVVVHAVSVKTGGTRLLGNRTSHSGTTWKSFEYFGWNSVKFVILAKMTYSLTTKLHSVTWFKGAQFVTDFCIFTIVFCQMHEVLWIIDFSACDSNEIFSSVSWYICNR